MYFWTSHRLHRSNCVAPHLTTNFSPELKKPGSRPRLRTLFLAHISFEHFEHCYSATLLHCLSGGKERKLVSNRRPKVFKILPLTIAMPSVPMQLFASCPLLHKTSPTLLFNSIFKTSLATITNQALKAIAWSSSASRWSTTCDNIPGFCAQIKNLWPWIVVVAKWEQPHHNTGFLKKDAWLCTCWHNKLKCTHLQKVCSSLTSNSKPAPMVSEYIQYILF